MYSLPSTIWYLISGKYIVWGNASHGVWSAWYNHNTDHPPPHSPHHYLMILTLSSLSLILVIVYHLDWCGVVWCGVVWCGVVWIYWSAGATLVLFILSIGKVSCVPPHSLNAVILINR